MKRLVTTTHLEMRSRSELRSAGPPKHPIDVVRAQIACPELNRGDAPVTRTNSLETVRNMVASGLGVSVLPRDALTPKYHSRLVVPVPFSKPVPSRRIALAHRRSFPRPRAIAVIRDAVAACRRAPPRRDAAADAARA